MPLGAAAAPLSAVASGVGIASTVAGGIANSRAQRQRQNQFGDLLKQAQGNSADLFGTRPEFTPVDYTPLYLSDPGYRQLAGDVIAGDLENLPAASQLSAGINKAITASSRERIEGWDPSFQGAMDTLYSSRNDVLKGRLPYSDALAITADRGRLANDLGMSGGAGPQIAADLGMKRLDLMTNVGPSLTSSIASILNTVDPIQRHTTPAQYLLEPSQIVPIAAHENQFAATFGLQQALESAMFDALPDPGAQGLFNLQMAQAGMSGNGSGSIFGAVGQGLGALGGMFGQQANRGGGGFWPGNNNIWTNSANQAFDVGNGGFARIPRAQLA
jgi:hypothetical protein